MFALKKRKVSLYSSQSNINYNTNHEEDVIKFDSIESKSLNDQLKYYKNKLVFLELPEIREEYGKDYVQKEIKDTTEKFRNLLQKKENNSIKETKEVNKNIPYHIMMDIY
jgi:hypothetical protein